MPNQIKSTIMPLSKFKYVFGFLAIVAILVWTAVFQITDRNLHIYFLEVGQGDSIYVRTMNNYDLLIDGGPDKKVLSELGSVMPFWDRKIDLVILTHPHADHLAGLIEVLKRYQVGEIISTDAINTSPEYMELLRTIKDNHIFFHTIKTKDTKIVDRVVNLDFIWPIENYNDKQINDLNETSVVCKLTYNKFSVLLTGDINKEVEQKLLSDNSIDFSSNILKIPHHGSSTGLDENFLKAVYPDIAVIMVGEKNKFGHPSQAVLNKLSEYNIKTLRTDQNGNIEIISNGQSFWTNVEKE
jgi:competence protein ComEC